MENKELRIFGDAVAVVTGGASGIGRALCEELARRRCEVVIADRQIDAAQALASQIMAAGGRASALALDVTDAAAVAAVIRETKQTHGRLDYLFNNAGISIGGAIHQYSLEDWNRILDVNLRGVIHGVHAALPIMLAQGFGHIVNTASLSGLIPFASAIAYATTKHAVVGLSKSLRAATAMMGIRVSALCPGFVQTPILQGGGKFGKSYIQLPPEVMQRIARKRRAMPPELFAQRALDGVAANQSLILGRGDWWLAWRMHGLMPAWSLWLSQRLYEKALIRLGLWQKTASQGLSGLEQ